MLVKFCLIGVSWNYPFVTEVQDDSLPENLVGTRFVIPPALRKYWWLYLKHGRTRLESKWTVTGNGHERVFLAYDGSPAPHVYVQICLTKPPEGPPPLSLRRRLIVLRAQRLGPISPARFAQQEQRLNEAGESSDEIDSAAVEREGAGRGDSSDEGVMDVDREGAGQSPDEMESPAPSLRRRRLIFPRAQRLGHRSPARFAQRGQRLNHGDSTSDDMDVAADEGDRWEGRAGWEGWAGAGDSDLDAANDVRNGAGEREGASHWDAGARGDDNELSDLLSMIAKKYARIPKVPLECPICHKKCAHMGRMAQHAGRFGCVYIEGSRTVMCEDCGTILKEPTALAKHKKSQVCGNRCDNLARQPDRGAKHLFDRRERVRMLRDGIEAQRIQIGLAVMKQLSTFR